MAYIPKSYQKLQLITYEVHTLTPVALNGSTPSGTVVRPSETLDNADASNRVSYLLSVLKWIRTARSAHIDGSQTLKVFLAPEFYFRPLYGGPSSSYANEDMKQIYQAIKAHCRAEAAYADWLIAPGTIFWSAENKIGNTKAIPVLYRNSAMAFKGGHAEAPEVYVEKRLVSTLDSAPMDINRSFKQADVGATVARENFFSIDGIQFCLEVCLDHGIGLVAGTLKQWNANWGAKPNVKVHLLTACGMPFGEQNCASPTALMLRCDGHPKQSPSEMRGESLLPSIGGMSIIAQDQHETLPVGLQLKGHDSDAFSVYCSQNL